MGMGSATFITLSKSSSIEAENSSMKTISAEIYSICKKNLNLNLKICSCKKQAKSIGNHLTTGDKFFISCHPISYSCLTVCTDERLNGPVVGRWSIRAGTLLMYQSLYQGAGGAGV